MLHFDANPIRIGSVCFTEFEQLISTENTKKFKNGPRALCQYLVNNICHIRLIPLDRVTLCQRWAGKNPYVSLALEHGYNSSRLEISGMVLL